ncbi:hypothetical protein [Pseudarthrobacter sp. PS3-L1]|uniref:hypothetical protein n=1 Tax=Pseudarthrobacter sp. PS3-L1 TaxID=3046207 RepID=UPI0024BA84F5|nr:hypothetical protein [Pseudarthrobacter sp. PS3-L1]
MRSSSSLEECAAIIEFAGGVRRDHRVRGSGAFSLERSSDPGTSPANSEHGASGLQRGINHAFDHAGVEGGT